MKKMLVVCLLAVAIVCAQPRKLKVLISVDMEGVAGVVSGDQLGPGNFEYERFRQFMTQEAVAAVNGARAAGATEIVVGDSHGNGENLLIEKFPPDVKVIRSWPRRLGMMGGIDATFDAVLFIGYHSSTSNLTGVRAHTFSSARLTGVTVNGVNQSEGSWNAAIAGQFNVPVVFISGDDAAIAEVRALVGPLESVETKKALGFHSAISLTPDAAAELIRTKTASALGRLKSFRPLQIGGPITLEIAFKHYRVAEVLAYLRGVDRFSPHAIRYQCKDMLEASDFLQFLTHFSLNLEP
jgi:D-amino peptidase